MLKSKRIGPPLAGLCLLATGSVVAAEEITLADLPRLEADVVILGEVHDNPRHHENQAAGVAVLRPAALVFEMFGPDAALSAESVSRVSMTELEAALNWGASGWPDFEMYYPIFTAALGARLFGGAVSGDDLRTAVDQGAAAAIGGAAPIFGLDRPLDPEEQSQRNAGQGVAHCDAIPEDRLPGMVEAQRLRDAALARAVGAALAETGGPVVVITGNGHARTDWGMPRYLSRAFPDASVLSVGQLEGAPDVPPPYDYWFVTEAAERDDPCAVFRNRD